MVTMKMSPAEYVIHIFGGVRATARALKKTPTCISKWRQSLEQGGTGGKIPSKAQQEILLVAQTDKLDITPSDLVIGRTVRIRK